MFSVNIDKIVVMTDNEKKCYEELRENLKKELNGGKVLAITKNGIGAFKIAYSFVCAGEKVLFIDADIMSEIFLIICHYDNLIYIYAEHISPPLLYYKEWHRSI